MSVEIREVTSKKELKKFVKFNIELYKGNPYHVPGLIEEEMMTLDKKKNPAFEVLDKLYSRLQIEVMNLPYGVTMEYRNGLGIVLNYSDQPYQFALPQGAKVLIGTPNIATAGVLVFKF